MATLIDSYSETNVDTDSNTYSGLPGFGQSFTGKNLTLDSAVFYLKKTGSIVGNAVYKIYAHQGLFGTTSTPTGAALATSDTLDVSTLLTTYQLITLNFSGANRISLTNGTHYCVTCEYSGGNGTTDFLSVGYDSSSPTAFGNAMLSTGGSWISITGSDTAFYVYGSSPFVGFTITFI